MSLLPSEPDTSAAEEADPRVIGVDSDDADDVLSALSSDTARELLSELHRDPAPPAEVADRVGTSLQNAQYHIEKLEAAGAIEVIDTVYSEKGREMNVYAPADRPLVIFAGDEDQTTGIRAALSRLLGSLGILAVASLAVQALFGQGVLDSGTAPAPTGGEDGGGTGGAPAAGGGAGANDSTATTAAEPDVSARANGTEDGDAFNVAEVTEAEPETVTPTAAPESGGGETAMPSATETEPIEGAYTTEPAATEAPTEAPPQTAPDGATPTDAPVDGAERTATEAVNTTAANATDAAQQGIDVLAAFGEPGLLFFLGGATALCIGAALWYATN
jgi:DNA-binding transcriptional ArsR family regulator